jgi:hypothetical protein
VNNQGTCRLEFAVADGNKWGWTAGTGLGFAPGWSGFLEYDYLGFGSDVHVVKTGVNFHF